MDDTIHEAIPLDGTAEDAPTVRAAARAVLRRAGCDEDLTGDALLCLSELVTNALLHAGGSICVEITASASTVRLAVTDGMALVDRLAQATGRGLDIVDQLTQDWGVVETTADGRPAKTVWAQLAVSPPQATGGLEGTSEAVLVDVPIRLFLASETHLAQLLRDVELLAADWTSRRDRVVRSLAEALRRNHDARQEAAETVRRQMGAGEDVVTLRFPVDPDTPARATEFLDVVDQSEARAGRIDDVDPSADELRHFRRWYAAELTHQALGGPPRRCPFRP